MVLKGGYCYDTSILFSHESRELREMVLFVHAVLEISHELSEVGDSAVLVQREIAVCFHDSLFERKHPVIAQWMNGLN